MNEATSATIGALIAAVIPATDEMRSVSKQEQPDGGVDERRDRQQRDQDAEQGRDALAAAKASARPGRDGR